MESTGRDGRSGPWSYYREQPGSYSYSSSSGTVSTAYTSTSSRLSWMSMEAARHFREMEMEDHPVSMEMEAVMDDVKFVQSPKETAREKKMKQIKILVEKFFGAPAVKFSFEAAYLMSALRRWFAELGVGWVLHVADGRPAREFTFTRDASSWISALAKIMDTFRLASGLPPVHGSAEEEEPASESDEEQNMAEEQLQLASFTQKAMLKMLTFVDFIVAPNLTREVSITDWEPQLCAEAYDKLNALLLVREAVSHALSQNRWPLESSSSAAVATILRQTCKVLSVKEGKAEEAIWSTMEEIRTRILESVEDGQGSSGTQTPQGSSDIDKATRSFMVYVMFLLSNYAFVAPIVSEAASLGKYVPGVGALQPLTSLAAEMVACLEEKLANKSKAFPDQGLRFLFLLNNLSFIVDKLRNVNTPNFFKSYMVNLAVKVEGYMESYIRVSWAPVLSCLINPTSSCLGKNYSPLPKFESEFQMTYTTQKLWKVPDSKLRNRLRRAIVDKVIPGYTRYLADDYGNAPLKFSPSYLEDMLQELFEG